MERAGKMAYIHAAPRLRTAARMRRGHAHLALCDSECKAECVQG
jgi:hypothetical protein